MKNYKLKIKNYELLLLFVAVLMNGCSFLEEHPSSALTEEKAFGSMTALRNNAVLSVYMYLGGNADSQGLQGTGRGVYDLNSLTTDEQIIPTRGGDWYDGGYWQDLHNHAWTADDRSIRDTWDYLFKVVMLTNSGIAHIEAYDQPDKDTTLLAAYKAELRAVRAMYYWYLLDMYGRVPIVTCTDIPTEEVQLASRKEVYDFAVKELQESMPLLPQDVANEPLGQYYGRMTYYVASIVLMKLWLNHVVYTGTEQPALYDSIVNYADKLSLFYELETNLRTNFSLDNDRSRENIYVIPREVGKYVAQYKYEHRTLHYNHAAALGMGGENGTSATLETLDVFGYKTAQQDPRFELYFYYDTVWVDNKMIYREDGKTPLVYEPDKVALDVSGTPYEKTAGARLNKYEHDPNGIQDCNVAKNDIVLFRYADVVLMKGEAKLRKGQSAYAEIKKVRDRVGAGEIVSPTLEDIYEERWRELMWEGWHRNDMIRFGKWTGHTTVFPIPQDMLLIHNDWKQNTGY
jgi:hypothetical protein